MLSMDLGILILWFNEGSSRMSIPPSVIHKSMEQEFGFLVFARANSDLAALSPAKKFVF